jgi:dTDP-4-amino-4,6-dideoxygalactose transaminase
MMHVRWVSPESHVRGPLRIDPILESGNFTRSVHGRRLENEASRLIGRPCLAVNSGTTGVWASFMALRERIGETVIVPAFGFPATPRMAALGGLRLIVVDVCEDAPVISPAEVAAAMDESISVVSVTNYFDTIVDCDAIRQACGKRQVAIMEDSAGSLLARDGSLQACAGGDISVASLHASKIVTSGEGGLVFTRSESTLAHLDRIRANGLADTVWYRASEQMGMNLVLPELSAALALASLDTVAERIADRRRVRSAYEERLRDLVQSGRVRRLRNDAGRADRFGAISLAVDNRDFVLRTLRLSGVEARACWSTLATDDQVIIPSVIRAGTLKHARYWRDHVINLPVHETMSESMIDYVIAVLDRALRARVAA